MIRYATIGTNFIVEWFLKSAKLCEHLYYSVTYSRSEKTAREFSNQHGAHRIETSLEALAEAEDVDAVYVASPNSLHFKQAALFLSHKKHVLCEKTITTNKKELDRLLEIAKENNVVLLEAVPLVHLPCFSMIKENLTKLGTIRRVSLQYGKYSSRYDQFLDGVIENAFNPALSNGALMDIGVYCVHTLVSLFGLPHRVLADGIFLKNGIDGAGTILASYPGMQAELLYSKISNNHLPCQIQGENGTMIIQGQLTNPSRIEIWYGDGTKEMLIPEGQENHMLPEIQEWIRLIENQEYGAVHNQFSLMKMEVMDEVRNQLGIVFPEDKAERWRLK